MSSSKHCAPQPGHCGTAAACMLATQNNALPCRLTYNNTGRRYMHPCTHAQSCHWFRSKQDGCAPLMHDACRLNSNTCTASPHNLSCESHHDAANLRQYWTKSMHAPNLNPNKTKSGMFFDSTVLLCRGCSHRATQPYSTQSQADIWKLKPNTAQHTASSTPPWLISATCALLQPSRWATDVTAATDYAYHLPACRIGCADKALTAHQQKFATARPTQL
jgi:hypothetical protein